jgi:hypothetical protein
MMQSTDHGYSPLDVKTIQNRINLINYFGKILIRDFKRLSIESLIQKNIDLKEWLCINSHEDIKALRQLIEKKTLLKTVNFVT